MGKKRWQRKCQENFDAFGSPSVDDCMKNVGYGMYSGPSGGGTQGPLEEQKKKLLAACCARQGKDSKCCGAMRAGPSDPIQNVDFGMRRGGFINRGRFRG